MEYMYNGLQLKGRNLQDDQKNQIINILYTSSDTGV